MCISLKTSPPEIEANYLAAEILISDNKFIELSFENYTFVQIASEIGVLPELVMIKAHLLNCRGYKLNVPYIPQANFLGKVYEKN